MWRCVGAVWDRGAGSFPLVLGIGPLRRPSVQPGAFPRGRRAVGKESTAPQVRRGSEAFFVPQLHVVVPPGLVQGAAVTLQAFVGGVPSHWHRGVHLREAGLSPGAAVGVLDRVVLPVAGRKL